MSGALVSALAILAILIATLPAGGPRTTPKPKWTCLVCGSYGGTDVILNVLLFVPLGIGLGLLGVRWTRVVGLSLLTSLLVESWQYFGVSGRDPTLSDLLTNTTGSTIGAFAVMTADEWLAPSRRDAGRLTLVSAALVCAVLALTAFGLLPSIRQPWLYYAQIDPRPSNEPFGGKLLSQSLNGVPITAEGELWDADRAPRPIIVDRRIRLDAAIVPGPTLPRRAPIVRIVNSDLEPVVFAQQRDALLFRVRLRAADARLAVPALAIGGALSRTPPAPPETLHVTGQFERRGLRLAITRAGEVRSGVLPYRVTLGWMMVWPFSVAEHGVVALWSGAWLAVLVLPVGYWGARAPRVSTAVGATAITASLLVLPIVAELSTTGPIEWLGGAAGFAAGWVMSRLVEAT